MPRVLIAGGGTGGHVFPGLAVARALQQLADVEVVFAGSPRGLESRVVPEHGYRLELLDVEPMKGGGVGRAFRGAMVAARATQAAGALVRTLQPSAVLSVGGYAAGPAALACVLERVPLAILEPNSTLGLANRILAPFASRAYLAWPVTRRHFHTDKAKLFGVPLRAGFEPRPVAASEGPRRVLVLGGSQGAAALNEAVPRALARLIPDIKVSVVHQTGRDREGPVGQRYQELGIEEAQVFPFLDDVAARIAQADLVIARAGAVTVAELCAIGRAALFVPFPQAADDHQAKNALSLAEVGGAVCLRQELADEARLESELRSLLLDDTKRSKMAAIAREHGRPNASEDIAADLLHLAGISRKRVEPSSKPHSVTNGGSPSRASAPIPKELV
jgi:UDP-N-acetylglucosamine--N-acetylmuramyl-(pentapeptide) pyrophosphoryl-undecaprenol N-acetylglucosamine transferase